MSQTERASGSKAPVAVAVVVIVLLVGALLLLLSPADTKSRGRDARGPGGAAVTTARVALAPPTLEAQGAITTGAPVKAGSLVKVADAGAKPQKPGKHLRHTGIAALWSGAATSDPVDPDDVANRKTGVRGRVVDSRGAPVEGATVQLSGSKDSPVGSMKKVGGNGLMKTFVMRGGGGGAPMGFGLGGETESREEKTDADGRFVVLGLSVSYHYTIEITPPPAWIDATADAPSLKQDEVVDAGDVKVARAATISGIVLLPGGAPARGAWVGLDSSGGMAMGGGGTMVAFAAKANLQGTPAPDDSPPDGVYLDDPVKTDDAGRFTIEHVEPGEHAVVAAKRGFRSARSPRIEAKEGEPTTGLELKLQDGLKLVVVVKDGEKRPIRGAKVTTGPGGFMWAGSQSGDAVVTDEQGEAVLAGLASSELTVSIQADGYSAYSRSISLDSGEERRVFVLQEGVDVTGQLVDESGKPVKEASVWSQPQVARAFSRDDMMQHSASYAHDQSGEDGRFRLKGLAPGDYQIQAQAQGVSHVQKEVSLAKGAGTVDLGVLRMGSLGTIVAIVLGPDDKPIAGATVQANRDQQGGMVHVMYGMGGSTNETDAQGKIELKDLEPGDYTVTARKDGFSDGSQGGIKVAIGAPAQATIRLAAGGTVTGTVMGADGTPKSGVWVWLMKQGAGFGTAQAATDANGRVEFAHVPAGTYKLGAQKGTDDVGGTWFTVADGATVTRTMRSQVQPTLDGTVRRADGSPVPGAQVAFGMFNAFPVGPADAEVFPQKTTTTDTAGRFHLDELTVGGSQGVTITTPEGKKLTYKVSFPDSGSLQRDFVLPAPSTLVVLPVSVVDENAQPLAGATVTLEGDDPTRPVVHSERTTDESGSARLDGIQSGRSYKLSVSASGYATTSLTTLVSETPAVVRLVLPRGGSLFLKTQTSGATGPSYATVSVTSTADASDTRKAFAAIGQKVRISGLKIGATYEVAVSAPGFQAVKITLRVDGDPETPQTLTLAPG
ncbi:carboxypeptidase regulatory-like domain-containing protein [bacterium]|nr:carboxypeptidase regulatory-like domain-containing protein [bacterium]